ncbi:MAG: hypothetical protein ACLFUF_07285, partial [Opitutales bacterium]
NMDVGVAQLFCQATGEVTVDFHRSTLQLVEKYKWQLYICSKVTHPTKAVLSVPYGRGLGHPGEIPASLFRKRLDTRGLPKQLILRESWVSRNFCGT